MRHVLSVIFISLLVLAAAGVVAAQTLIDFGSSARLTAHAPRTWNNVDPAAMAVTTQLVDVNGFPTGADLLFTPGKLFTNANNSGTSSPAPNSPLARLNYPISALSDYLYGSSSRPLVEFTLTNLDLNAVYDFTLCASRMGVNDVRTTRYTFSGANSSAVVLDAANNTSTIAAVTGIGPDGSGNITVHIQAAPSNTNTAGYFYVNAMEMAKRGGNPLPPTLAFSQRAMGLSRVAGKPASQLPLTVSANRSPAPTISVTAIDQATNRPPTWLTFPAVVTGGQVFQLGFGGSALTIGSYRATFTATATGYNPATATVTLAVRPTGSLNLLYYGNSFSLGNGTVPALVEYIAEDFGIPAPNTIARLAGGTKLAYHLTGAHAAAITTALSPGEEWDYVIMQGFSTEATDTLGNPTAFRADAKTILTNVRAHSPSAKGIMFQTWARGQGHSFYQGPNPTFSGPLEMHRQIEKNYGLAVADMNQAFGPDSARRAACGETAALFNFVPAIYANDIYHAGPPITLMSAMSIFTAIYGKSIGGFEPNFSSNTNLIGRLKSFSMGDDDWRKYAGIADRVADPALRHAPGSGEDLLLQTGVSGPLDARPVKEVAVGKTFTVAMTSPIGTYSGGAAFIVMSWFPTGSRPTPPVGLPEIQIDLVRYMVVAWTPSLGNLSWQLPVTATVPGWSLLFQAAALQPSSKTGRAFTVTDGHEIRMK